MIPISGQAVDTDPDQEMRSDFLGRAEELVDVALAITDVDASSCVTERLRGLRDIFQPTDALLLLYGSARRIDLLLERGRRVSFGMDLMMSAGLAGSQVSWSITTSGATAAIASRTAWRSEGIGGEGRSTDFTQ